MAKSCEEQLTFITQVLCYITNMNKYITHFKVYKNDKLLDQNTSIQWLAQYHNQHDQELFEKYAVKATDIYSREVYALGIGHVPTEGVALYARDEQKNPSMEQRSAHAQEKMEEIFQQLYQDQEYIPQYLNHVTCTHYQSPSAGQKMVVKKEWHRETIVTHLYHMGCHAALPAIRVSKAAIADGAQNVDVVHTELCSYHLNKDINNPEQAIMKTLFADGAIKYCVSNEDNFLKSKKDGFEIIQQKEALLPNTEKEMSWEIGSNGFQMTLTKSVPLILAKKIEGFMRELFCSANLDYDQLKEQTIFAIHPGGPKIIDLIERILDLENTQVKHSKKILRTRGNMSSATIPHIWNEILEDKQIQDQRLVATVAFGPGLTITGAILKLCRQ